MKRAVLTGLVWLAVAAGALALRLPSLERRPMHTDEAIHAWKFDALRRGEYRYDYGDLAKTTPLLKMYTLGCDFTPPTLHAIRPSGGYGMLPWEKPRASRMGSVPPGITTSYIRCRSQTGQTGISTSPSATPVDPSAAAAGLTPTDWLQPCASPAGGCSLCPHL